MLQPHVQAMLDKSDEGSSPFSGGNGARRPRPEHPRPSSPVMVPDKVPANDLAKRLGANGSSNGAHSNGLGHGGWVDSGSAVAPAMVPAATPTEKVIVRGMDLKTLSAAVAAAKPQVLSMPHKTTATGPPTIVSSGPPSTESTDERSTASDATASPKGPE